VVSLRDRLRDLVSPPEPVAPGLYHYRRELAGREMRLHLRVDPDRRGLLVVDASAVLHLNPTATELMKHVLDGRDEADAVARVLRVYRGDAGDVRRDHAAVLDLVRQLETSEDACPVARVDLPFVQPFGRVLPAPYRADLALTYACNNDCAHCYVARRPGEVDTMDLDGWKTVLRRLWDAGVPHVCFTGGEATLSPHLVPLVERAEDIGLVAGLLTNGRKLADRALTARLVAAGLDHVQITIESHDEKVHDEMVGTPGAFRETVRGIENALAEDIYLVTNTTLCTLNAGGLEETLGFLHSLGVRQVAMNSFIHTGRAPESGLGFEEQDLEPLLGLASERASELGLRFIWYSPTRYCEMDPTTHGLGLKRCTAAEYSVCIEPDGQVLPCQSFYEPAGSILEDDWETIWNSPLFRKIRERGTLPEMCDGCPDLEACGGGCPLAGGDRFVCRTGGAEG
jgi:radical SAM protein with 4Fe4S-binding SPASM domain